VVVLLSNASRRSGQQQQQQQQQQQSEQQQQQYQGQLAFLASATTQLQYAAISISTTALQSHLFGSKQWFILRGW
jgi:hypothetical protein